MTQSANGQAPGRLIALTGIDGAGKSTLAESLHRTLNDAGHRVVLVGKTTVTGPPDPQLARYLDAVNNVVYRDRPTAGHACGDTYWLLALAAWYALQDTLVVRPELARGTSVILDNTPHKILARYQVNPDIPDGLVDHAFAGLTVPDTVIHLRIPPPQALRRKQTFTALETGRTGADPDHFVSYQARVATHLDAQGRNPNWTTLDVADRSPDDVLAAALAAVAPLLDYRMINSASPTS